MRMSVFSGVATQHFPLGGTVAYPKEYTLHGYMEDKVVAEYPDALALEVGNERWTYKELNAQTNQLARYLRNNFGDTLDNAHASRKGEAFVALYLNRDAHMVFSMLAVLKAHGAYVPIAPEDPCDWNAKILQDCRPCVVLCHAEYKDALESIVPSGTSIVAVEEALVQAKTLSPENLLRSSPMELAYMMYSSGASPKGTLNK